VSGRRVVPIRIPRHNVRVLGFSLSVELWGEQLVQWELQDDVVSLITFAEAVQLGHQSDPGGLQANAIERAQRLAIKLYGPVPS
jgi:hypothetical protein